MNIDVVTFLVTIYTILDDLYQAHFAPHRPRRRGPQPRMSDSEVLMLAILSQWSLHRSERWMLAYAREHWSAFFPYLLGQSEFNVRVRDLAGTLCQLGPLLAERLGSELGLDKTYEAIDAVPVPLMRRCRGDRHRLFANEADVGRGGADKEYYYGVKVTAAVSAAGLITGFVIGPASTEERFLAEAMFRSRRDPQAAAPKAEELEDVLGPAHRNGGKRKGPAGPISRLGAGAPSRGPYVSDLGLRGAAWQAHWRGLYQAVVLTKDAYEALPPEERRKMSRWLNSIRQKVETSFAWLESRLGLKYPRARSWWGLLARIGAKVAAFNCAKIFNYLKGLPPNSVFDPLI